MPKIKPEDAIRKADPDFYYEYLHENKKRNFDTSKTRYTLKPEEVAKLRKNDNYWQNERLKAWSKQYQKIRKKTSLESLEYLL